MKRLTQTMICAVLALAMVDVNECEAAPLTPGDIVIVGVATGGVRMAPDRQDLAALLGGPLGGLTVLDPGAEARLSLLGLRAGSGWPPELVAS